MIAGTLLSHSHYNLAFFLWGDWLSDNDSDACLRTLSFCSLRTQFASEILNSSIIALSFPLFFGSLGPGRSALLKLSPAVRRNKLMIKEQFKWEERGWSGRMRQNWDHQVEEWKCWDAMEGSHRDNNNDSGTRVSGGQDLVNWMICYFASIILLLFGGKWDWLQDKHSIRVVVSDDMKGGSMLVGVQIANNEQSMD